MHLSEAQERTLSEHRCFFFFRILLPSWYVRFLLPVDLDAEERHTESRFLFLFNVNGVLWSAAPLQASIYRPTNF